MTTLADKGMDRPGWFDRIKTIPERQEHAADDRRRANDAALVAVTALIDGETAHAKRSAYLADSLDDSGKFGKLPGAIEFAVAELTSGGKLTKSTWDRLDAAVDDAPLRLFIRHVRTA